MRYLLDLYISWHLRFLFWQTSYFGFFFDELFSLIINSLFLKFLIISGTFLFDKFIAPWLGPIIIKYFQKLLHYYFSIENSSIMWIIIFCFSCFWLILIVCLCFFLC